MGSEGKQEIGTEGEGRDKILGSSRFETMEEASEPTSEPKPAHDQSCDLLHLQRLSDVSFSKIKFH